MLPVRTILWPTDFSPRARQSLDIACELAEHFGATLKVVHVLTALPGMFGPTASPMPVDVRSYQTALEDEASRNLESLVTEHVPPDVQATAHVAWGEPAREIVRLSAEHEADLIVVATRGETGLSRFVSGSVTEKIVRLASCPVLTVQPDEEDE